MRILVTGVDADGRSCVVDENDQMFASIGPGFAIADLFSTPTAPPPPRPEGHADFIDMGLAPGIARWIMIEYGPGATTPHHHTDSVDFAVVVAGSVDLTLDDGVHPLAPGDCVVMTGVDHSWTAGPAGCHLSVCCLGSPPPG